MIPHAYQCACEQCRSMAAAIGSEHKGRYFYSDEELLKIAESRNARCDCTYCRELHADMKRQGETVE